MLRVPSVFVTPAAAVRTGYKITTVWAHSTRSLEVETVTHGRFTDSDGTVHAVVRFTGWELFNGVPIHDDDGNRIKHVDGGWTQPAHGEVEVQGLEERSFGALTGRSDVTRLQRELDDFLAAL